MISPENELAKLKTSLHSPFDSLKGSFPRADPPFDSLKGSFPRADPPFDSLEGSFPRADSPLGARGERGQFFKLKEGIIGRSIGM